jgi:hypothetical protein
VEGIDGANHYSRRECPVIAPEATPQLKLAGTSRVYLAGFHAPRRNGEIEIRRLWAPIGPSRRGPAWMAHRHPRHRHHTNKSLRESLCASACVCVALWPFLDSRAALIFFSRLKCATRIPCLEKRVAPLPSITA